MAPPKLGRESDRELLARVAREMAEPRLTKSVREALASQTSKETGARNLLRYELVFDFPHDTGKT
ncbi:MAG: hypothetical protein ACRD4H_04685 [Candidatus Acidiferrales bacterium]